MIFKASQAAKGIVALGAFAELLQLDGQVQDTAELSWTQVRALFYVYS